MPSSQNHGMLIMISTGLIMRAKSFDMFDSHKLLFNCMNGTYDLENNRLNPFNPFDYITKMSNAKCDRLKQFVSEIMQNNE